MPFKILPILPSQQPSGHLLQEASGTAAPAPSHPPLCLQALLSGCAVLCQAGTRGRQVSIVRRSRGPLNASLHLAALGSMLASPQPQILVLPGSHQCSNGLSTAPHVQDLTLFISVPGADPHAGPQPSWRKGRTSVQQPSQTLWGSVVLGVGCSLHTEG